MPTLRQWQQLPSILSRKEKILLVFFGLLFFTSFILTANAIYTSSTEVVPTRGGTVTEGKVGSPRLINPVYSEANDNDRDLVRLIYSGLFKYGKDGAPVPDLAKDWDVSGNGTVYDVTLRNDAIWHDGVPFTAKDVVYTVEQIQNSSISSPIRANWIGVQVEEVSQYQVRFILQSPYAPFLERLTLPIIPQHVWNDIPDESFPLSGYNQNPIGTGPYMLASLKKNEDTGSITEVTLEPNHRYHNGEPYVGKFIFRFYNSKDELAEAARSGEVDIYSLPLSHEHADELIQKNRSYEFYIPRTFSVFFNIDSDGIYGNRDMRLALWHALDRDRLVKEAIGRYGMRIDSPMRPDLFGLEKPENVPGYDIERATEIIETAGYVRRNGVVGEAPDEPALFTQRLESGSTGEEVRQLQTCLAEYPDVYPDGTVSGNFGSQTEEAVSRFQEMFSEDILEPEGLSEGTGVVAGGTRAKLNEVCGEENQVDQISISLTYPENSLFHPVAENIKTQWEEFGIRVDLQQVPSGEFEQNIIKERGYQALLFGQIMGTVQDPFPYWHSSQVLDPGLNLSLYDNRATDEILEVVREQIDKDNRNDSLQELQERLLDDVPAIFLYDSPYVYVTNGKIRGIEGHTIVDPSHRFSNVTEWYINTKRIW